MNQEAPQFTHEDRKAGIYKTVAILLIIITVLIGMFIWRVLQPRVMSPKELYNAGAVMYEIPREVSPFSLIDKSGLSFERDDLKGKWTFVFFGFTHCPDICPTTIALFNQLDKKLQATEWSDTTRFLLVTLDPARDTPEKLAEYVNYFNPDIEGLTGDFVAIKNFANEVNVAFNKVVTNHETGEYTVDHSGAVILMNVDGRFQGFYKTPLDLERIALTYGSIRLGDKKANG